MATGGREGVEADVSGRCCGVCGERYRRPKLLPCLHSYCQSCLQAVVGTAPSFPCPACRVRVLLPAGGVPALQTNHYIVREQSLASTAPPRLCDVCTEDREATHSCLHCRQRYCGRCRDVHDSISSCSSHTVVAVQAESQGEGDLQWDDPGQAEELCPRHQDQPLLLRCQPCRANICLRCKMTAHNTHSVDNLRDLGSKVKATLQERLQVLDQQASTVQVALSAARDRRDRLGAEHSSTEQGVRDRALRVKQLVQAAQDSTVGSLQAVNKDLADSLTATHEGLRRRHAALMAQTQHITRVLRADKDADLVDLEDRLDQMSLDSQQGSHGLAILQTEAEPYLCQHNPLAISAAQLQEFVGVLRMTDDNTAGAVGDSATPGTSDALSPGQTQSVSWSEQQSVIIQEVCYSRNPKSTVVAVCTTSEKRVWIKYKPSREGDIMALFDNQGLVRNALQDFPADIIVTLPNDITLGFYSPKSHCYINIYGNPVGFISSLHHLQYFRNVSSVSKTCRNTPYVATNCECYRLSGISQHMYIHNMCLSEVFTHNEGLGCLKDVSHCDKYFVFGKDDGAHVYFERWGNQGMPVRHMFTYRPAPTHQILDACFFPVGGREVLVVLVEGDRQLHVVDHTDGCHFLHYLDTGHFTLDNPRLLATDQENALWVACDGGKLLSIQVTDAINPATSVSVDWTSWCTVM